MWGRTFPTSHLSLRCPPLLALEQCFLVDLAHARRCKRNAKLLVKLLSRRLRTGRRGESVGMPTTARRKGKHVKAEVRQL